MFSHEIPFSGEIIKLNLEYNHTYVISLRKLRHFSKA